MNDRYESIQKGIYKMVEEIIVKRNGQRNLRFRGELVASVLIEWEPDAQQKRKRAVQSLYMTSSGKYVFHSRVITGLMGENESNRAIICGSPEEFHDCLIGEDGKLSCISKKLLEEAAVEDSDLSNLTPEDLE